MVTLPVLWQMFYIYMEWAVEQIPGFLRFCGNVFQCLLGEKKKNSNETGN